MASSRSTNSRRAAIRASCFSFWTRCQVLLLLLQLLGLHDRVAFELNISRPLRWQCVCAQRRRPDEKCADFGGTGGGLGPGRDVWPLHALGEHVGGRRGDRGSWGGQLVRPGRGLEHLVECSYHLRGVLLVQPLLDVGVVQEAAVQSRHPLRTYSTPSAATQCWMWISRAEMWTSARISRGLPICCEKHAQNCFLHFQYTTPPFQNCNRSVQSSPALRCGPVHESVEGYRSAAKTCSKLLSSFSIHYSSVSKLQPFRSEPFRLLLRFKTATVQFRQAGLQAA